MSGSRLWQLRLSTCYLQSSEHSRASWSLSEQQRCGAALRSFIVFWSTRKQLFKEWLLCGGGKYWSSRKQHRPVFHYIVFLQWPSSLKQLSSWGIVALTNRPSMMSSICKKTQEIKKSLWSQTSNQMYILSCLTACEAVQSVVNCLKGSE